MRIYSLLPSATEIVASLGLADSLVAVSEERDWPPRVRSRRNRFARRQEPSLQPRDRAGCARQSARSFLEGAPSTHQPINPSTHQPLNARAQSRLRERHRPTPGPPQLNPSLGAAGIDAPRRRLMRATVARVVIWRNRDRRLLEHDTWTQRFFVYAGNSRAHVDVWTPVLDRGGSVAGARHAHHARTGPDLPCGRRPCRRTSYQSAWTAVPLCSVATVPLPPHAITAARSGQLSIPSCQCLAMPTGDS
jgi:hypothetical protein